MITTNATTGAPAGGHAAQSPLCENIGKCVGLLARAVNDKQFHVQRVGRLSREAAFLPELIAFRNDVIEKLAWQQRLYPNVVKAIRDSSQMVLDCKRYEREEFLTGFWSVYNRGINELGWDA